MADTFDEFLGEHPLTDSIDLLLPDLSGVLRGKRLSAAAVRSALDGEAFFTTTVYSIDTAGANVAESGLVWEEGDADRPLRLDPATLRPVPVATRRRPDHGRPGRSPTGQPSSPTAASSCWPSPAG